MIAPSNLWSLRSILVVSAAIRIGLILYSEWHDARSVVKYTDVDYRVFSDAARYLLHPDKTNYAQGPLRTLFGIELALGNPYTRDTYRYTPLLAVALAPNEWLHPSFGKYVFAICDIANGLLIYKILVRHVLPRSFKMANRSQQDIRERATTYAALHLLNPMVFSISTRGSSESVLCLFVLLTLSASLAGRWNVAAMLLGLSTHWKIYPAIYGFSCLAVVGHGAGRPGYLGTLLNRRTIKFGILSVSTFLVLGGLCYLLWGYPFLYESYLYHLHRLDHRHNFSPYFYLTYLTYPNSYFPPEPTTPWSNILRSPLISFVPQMTLSIGTGLLFGQRSEDLIFTWFVQTVVFVVFNKVCTSQYFLWYLLLLPLLAPALQTSFRQGAVYVSVWILSQALWLGEAYKLEFLGEAVFFQLWTRGLLYVASNSWILSRLMQDYKPLQSN